MTVTPFRRSANRILLGGKSATFMPWWLSRLALLTVLTLGVLALAGAGQGLAQDRTLSLYNTHTHERLTVTYKRNGRFVQEGLNQLNRFLRDWRRDEVTRIDPDLFDIVWTVYREVRASEPIHVVSAYRSPATNNILRSRSSGVAQNSQHTQGRAMDFFIPGVSAADIRAAGLRQQGGGVGYYPTSGTPFVHLDTGSIRMWPRMTRDQLSRVFPDGRTVHVPADGRPMPGFEQAQRDLQRNGGRSPTITTASSATRDQSDGDGDIVLPGESGGGFLAALFGGGRSEPEPSTPARVAVAPAPASDPVTASGQIQGVETSVEVASAPRERYAAPAPVLPPYASADGFSAAPSTIAGLVVPPPTPAPTLDEIQLASLGERPILTSQPGAIALDGAFAAAQTAQAAQTLAQVEPLPAINRAEQIAQSVPAPGQIAALIEARFAEQRAAQASLAGQVETALAPALVAQASQGSVAVQAPQALQTPPAGQVPFQFASAAPLPSQPPAEQTVAASPRFVPPVPTPVQRPLVLAATAPAPAPLPQNNPAASPGNSLIAAAFAAQDVTRAPAQSALAAQSAIASLAGTSTATAPITPGVTGQLYPIADDLSPGLAKQSIRGSQHAVLVAPTTTMTLSPVLMQSGSFEPANAFQARWDGFGAPGS